MKYIAYWFKFLIRTLDAMCMGTVKEQSVVGVRYKSFSTLFFPALPPSVLKSESEHYFTTLADLQPRYVIDAGAALGIFSLPLLIKYPGAKVFSFEPSLPQRTLFKRNLKLNQVFDRANVYPLCLWNQAATLSFRSHSYLSCVEGVSQITDNYPALERIQAVTLDQWWIDHGRPPIDLIKMDIEGAEIEALAGAKELLVTCKPTLIIAAYHLRDGVRTFEIVRDNLLKVGYSVSEVFPQSGLLFANPTVL